MKSAEFMTFPSLTITSLTSLPPPSVWAIRVDSKNSPVGPFLGDPELRKYPLGSTVCFLNFKERTPSPIPLKGYCVQGRRNGKDFFPVGVVKAEAKADTVQLGSAVFFDCKLMPEGR